MGSRDPQKNWKAFFDTPEGFADLEENIDHVQFQLGSKYSEWKCANYTSHKTDPSGVTHFYFLQGVRTYIAPWSKKLSDLLTSKVSMWPVYLNIKNAVQGNKLAFSDIYVLDPSEADVKHACAMYQDFSKTDTHVKIHNDLYTDRTKSSSLLGRIKFEGKKRRLQVCHAPFKGIKLSPVAEIPFPFDLYGTDEFKKYSSSMVDDANFDNYKRFAAGQYVNFTCMVMEGRIYPMDLEPAIPLFGRVEHKGGTLVATESWGQTVEGVTRSDVSRGHANLRIGRKFIPVPYRQAFRDSLTPRERPNLIITNDSISCTEVWGTTPQILITDLMEALDTSSFFKAITTLLPQELRSVTDIRTYIEGEECTQQLLLTEIRKEYSEVERNVNIYKKFYMDIALGKEITFENFIEQRMNPLFKRETNHSLKGVLFLGGRRLHRSHVFTLENQNNFDHNIAHDPQTRCVAVLDGTESHSILGEIELSIIPIAREEEAKTLDLFVSSNTAKIRMMQTEVNKTLLARFRKITGDQTFSTYDQKESHNSPVYTYCTMGLMGLSEEHINILIKEAALHPGFFMIRNVEHSREQVTVCTVSITTPGAAPYIMAYLQHTVLLRSSNTLGAQIYPLGPTEYQIVIPFRLDRDQLLTFLQEINKCPNSEGRGQLNALVNVIFQKVRYVISTRAVYKTPITPLQVRQVFRPSNGEESLNLFIVGFPVCTCTLRLKELMQKGGVTLSDETRMSWLQGQGDPYYTLKIVPETKEMRGKLLSLPLSTPNWGEYGLSLIPEASCQTERLRLIADLAFKLSHIEPDRSPPPAPILSGAQLGNITINKLLNLLPVKDTGPPPKLPGPAPPPLRATQLDEGAVRTVVNAPSASTPDGGFQEVQGRRRQKGSNQGTASTKVLVNKQTKPSFSEVLSEEETEDSEGEKEDKKVEKELNITGSKEASAPQSTLTPGSLKKKYVRSRREQTRYLEALVISLASRYPTVAVSREDRKKVMRDYVETLSYNLEETIEHLKNILGTAEGKDKEREMFQAYITKVKESTQDSAQEGDNKRGDPGEAATKTMKQNPSSSVHQQVNVEISKVVENLVDTFTHIAATPKERKKAIYRFNKHLALDPVTILDLLKEIQQGNKLSLSLLDKFLEEELASKQPALQPVPPNSAPSTYPTSVGTATTTSTTTFATVDSVAGATQTETSSATEGHEKEEATSSERSALGGTEMKTNSEVRRKGKGDGREERDVRGGTSNGLEPMVTDDPPSGIEEVKGVAGGEEGLGVHAPSVGAFPPPPSLPSLLSSQTLSAVSIESETPCPKSDFAPQTLSIHASIHSPPLSDQ